MGVAVTSSTLAGLKLLRAVLLVGFLVLAVLSVRAWQLSPACIEHGGVWKVTRCVMPDGSEWSP